MDKFESVKYSSLKASDDEDEMKFEHGSDYFQSAFTYARYNDLDNMGYEIPKRFRTDTGYSKYANFTYSRQEWENEDEEQPPTVIETVIVIVSYVLIFFTLPFSLLFAVKIIAPNEKLVVLRLGRAQKTRSTGATMVIPCVDRSHRIDMRVTAFNVPPLHIITVDRGLVHLGAVVFLQVKDALAAVCQVQDRNMSTRALASSMLYRFVSKKRVCELSNGYDRRVLAATFKDELAQFTQQFGVLITDVELSEIQVIKEPENMALSSLSTLAKSEVGQQIWNVVGPTLEQISKESSEKKEKTPQEEIDIDRIITIVNLGIDKSLVVAINKVYQFECEGLPSVVVDLKRGTCYKGTTPVPDVILRMDQSILVALLREEISPISCYMNGSLSLTGSMSDALQLRLLTTRIVHLL